MVNKVGDLIQSLTENGVDHDIFEPLVDLVQKYIEIPYPKLDEFVEEIQKMFPEYAHGIVSAMGTAYPYELVLGSAMSVHKPANVPFRGCTFILHGELHKKLTVQENCVILDGRVIMSHMSRDGDKYVFECKYGNTSKVILCGNRPILVVIERGQQQYPHEVLCYMSLLGASNNFKKYTLEGGSVFEFSSVPHMLKSGDFVTYDGIKADVVSVTVDSTITEILVENNQSFILSRDNDGVYDTLFLIGEFETSHKIIKRE